MLTDIIHYPSQDMNLSRQKKQRRIIHITSQKGIFFTFFPG